jgi:hypothetical protein
MLYGVKRNFTTQALLSTYAKYLHWYEDLTPVLRLGYNFTPSVLFAQYVVYFLSQTVLTDIRQHVLSFRNPVNVLSLH